MAVDEALIEGGGADGKPVLRFYGWRTAAASFGYSQPYGLVAGWTPLRPLVRRCTGGGLVAHEADWTYSLTVPAGHAWWQLRASASYQCLHEWLQDAFYRVGIETCLAPAPDTEGPGRCFIGAESSDLLYQGRKIAGAAQRRSRNGLLIQGSVQPPPSHVARSDWENALCSAASARWQVQWQSWEPGDEFWERAEQLADLKYRNPEYLKRR